jgi:Na+-transporting NADH:ubiquinone oxidoreductase subunit C
MKKDSIGYVVLFTFIACVAFIVPLAVANEATKAKVEGNRLFASHSAVLRAFGIAYSAPSEVEPRYASLVKDLPGGRGWKAELDGSTWYAVRKTGPGLWGSITLIVAADAAGGRLRGIEVLDQQETPGLGGRIDEAWFKEQFRGERLGPGGLAMNSGGSGKGDADHENASVDAVTGASLTSGFVKAIVNAAVADIKAVGGGK